ncbi:PREDICTED: EPIDERMAL PATTERNING FACTOR-like protein 6 isoform X1 [Camelina sativa]|uniref:Epidermal patterning factor-like protein n=1 Tax=Camelina sativa TaxID=90675 RepID=A0ABM0Z4N1_CAMSA|nr:PREDICTED: EPIDERMAL PATTERNING FACTOR-like protein 6 isoform X1 [Camelina sativa]XP_019101407.1 PREDICTED: EPIDERMAL PATTERNING FACTOR-like protein 6 isoform X1 [Camelina sativa]XP_019101408.1 PREDICTED: EPIDERMAL PATTERNING FACTOR-like protein 6 isoform X1 [Camelina sativa]XP_019101409.1 PREDICTED: EPIDERMAL PATTERNING FACTOR-like protein 6 isoform X1 [Camelina sativa]
MGLERPSSLSSSLPTSENSRANKFSLFYIFLLFIVFCVSTTFITPSSLSSPYIRNSYFKKLGNFYAQEEGKSTVVIKNTKKIGDQSKDAELRRILRGLGSSPPRCLSKCGRCTPCRPVHVPVPPGTPVTAEYYPEAWRCKCGNKFYMP